jgi:hypothetical protein
MKSVSDLIMKPKSEVGQEKELQPEQKDAIGYFFAKLRIIYGNQYLVNYPDEKTEAFAKREYARHIVEITREQMDEGFDLLHQQRQKNADEWRYMDVDKIIGLIKTGGEHWAQRVQRKAAEEARILEKGIEHQLTDDQRQKNSEFVASLRQGLK